MNIPIHFHLGFQEGTDQTRSFLESIPCEEIVNKLGFMSFRPIIDGRYIRDSAVNLYKSRTVNTVEFLMGCNSHEGALFTLGPLRPKGFENLVEARDLVRWMVELYFWDSVKVSHHGCTRGTRKQCSEYIQLFISFERLIEQP